MSMDDEHSNGIFSFNSTVQETNSNIRKLLDFETLFELEPGKIISRKNVLKAIDYIFYTWLKNIATISYTCELCHSNCHVNILNLEELPDLKNTGCCYCGRCK